jgi:Zn-finger nucleic acid-binding protein
MESDAKKSIAHRCPHCQKPVAATARICVHCNGPVIDRGEQTSEPLCPHCREQLAIIAIEGGADQAEACEKCRGVWLDLDEFRRTTNPQRIPKEYVESKNVWFKRSVDPVKYIACPRCGRLMNRENFSRISGIIVDRCRDHGVWLDAGELERLRLFIGQGGLDRYQDRRLDTLEEDLQGLANRTRDLEFITKLLNFWNVKRIIFQGL